MYRRAYPYETPHHQPIYQDPAYYHRPVSQQIDYANYYPYEQMQQQTPFEYYAKPNQPTDWPDSVQQYSNYYPFQPQQMQPQQQQQPNPTPSLFTQFQTGDGQVDVQKMLSTVGQLANTVQQVSPVLKEIGAMISIFRQ